jgi:hypothetical protein
MGVLKLFELASRMDKVGVTLTRVGLIVVLLWIGGLKAFRYEADGIVPFVANSPTMSFFYADPGELQGPQEPGRRTRAGESSVARGEPHLRVRLRPGNRDRAVRLAALPAPVAARRRRRSAVSWSS